MAGWLTNSVPNLNSYTGAELLPVDTQLPNGSNPQDASISLFQLTNAISFLGNSLSKTMVAGTRYYTSYQVGNAQTFTGASVLVGGTGGTDNWILELHGPTGLLLATTATAGTTAGTANTWQQIAFTATYNLTVPGTYYVALQSNGTTPRISIFQVAAPAPPAAPAAPRLTISAAPADTIFLVVVFIACSSEFCRA